MIRAVTPKIAAKPSPMPRSGILGLMHCAVVSNIIRTAPEISNSCWPGAVRASSLTARSGSSGAAVCCRMRSF